MDAGEDRFFLSLHRIFVSPFVYSAIICAPKSELKAAAAYSINSSERASSDFPRPVQNFRSAFQAPIVTIWKG
jgi:hypothetical protein